jgi:hypothetical protein
MLGHDAASRKVSGSSPDEVIDLFSFFSIHLFLPAALCPWGWLVL